jgi:hypothetical protein
MALNVQQIFTMQLARAAAKGAEKFLRVRRLQKSDRDDILAAALLWCWENREKYDSLTHDIDMWFLRAVRNAWESWRAKELPTSNESIEDMGGEDTTFGAVSTESDAKALLQQLTEAEREVVVKMMDGVTWREMIKQGVPQPLIRQTKAILQALRKDMPDTAARAVLARTEASVGSDDVSSALSNIDQAIERLEFAPKAGRDCPPCWRCMWFEGFMPAGKRSTRMDIEDPEVREAVNNTEARKIEIAQQVRDGL